MAGKHGCTGTTKKGTPCSAYPLQGRDVCLAHADAETRESVGFVAANGKGGRPKLPKPTELALQLVEQHAAALLRPHFKALGLMLHDDGTVTPLKHGAIVVHQGEATTIEDLGAQQAAAERLLDRVYGKPKQSTEVSGKDGTPLGAMFVTDPQLAEDARELLRRAASASSNKPSGPSASNQ
jgi:hypothetical protein